MHSSALFLAPLFFAASTLAQGPPEGIAPSSAPPAGCETNANGNFTIGTLKVGHTKRESALEAADSALVCTLNDGILRDRDARTGSVVANHQFQFDGPPQAGAIYTGGFSICANGSLAIGGSTRWWQCSSGPFYNLYDEWIGAQCEEIRIQVTFPQKPTPSSSSSAVAASSSASSSTAHVASVQSSLATITGAVSTVSKSAIGPSASFTGLPVNASLTAGSMSRSPSATLSGSASAATGAPVAPAAGGAAPVSFGVARGSMLGAFVVIFAAALIL